MNYVGALKRVAVMVTAQARAIMIEAVGTIKTKLGHTGLTNHIYYMDTDSFFLSREAFQIMRESGLVHQSKLGKFKD